MTCFSRSNGSSCFYLLLLISTLVLASHFHGSEALAKPPVKGLSYSFFSKTCPQLETIVRNHLKKVFQYDNGQAPGLVRILFHDCFAQGCDGSVLLDGVNNEREHIANGGIRTEALKTIDDLRCLIHAQCGRIVSCADITALAAREAIYLSGGPYFPVPLGRRDSLTYNHTAANNIPSPFKKTNDTLKSFANKNFDVTDVVAFSGVHTFGRAHCSSFNNRLQPIDPTMNKVLANHLRAICPPKNTINTANLDVRTPKVFDNKYYIDLLNHQGVFTSDQDLFFHPKTRRLVYTFAHNQKLFFQKFANAMIKLSQLDVITGYEGEIRAKCNVVNKK